MKYKIYSTLLATALLFGGCDKEIKYIDTLQSIQIQDIQKNTIDIYTGKTMQVQVTALPAEAKGADDLFYMYKSSNESVFNISGEGLLKAMSQGTAFLTVTCMGIPKLTTTAVVKVTTEYILVNDIQVDDPYKNYIMPVAAFFDLSKQVTVLPANASQPKLAYESSDASVVTVSADGVVTAVALGTATITMKTTDGSDLTKTCTIHVKTPVLTNYDRTGWTATASHALPADKDFTNAPESLLDGDTKTCLSMVKPGKTYGSVSVPKTDVVYFIVDMQKEQPIHFITFTHRSNNGYAYLRPYGYSLYGSKDGTTFDLLKENVASDYEAKFFTLMVQSTEPYRYVKVVYTVWDDKSGSTMQLSEVNIGSIGFE